MTDYIQNVLDNISDDGMTPELWDLVNDDVGRMKNFGISNDRERTLLFYIRRFLNDILSEFGIEKQPGLYGRVFEILKNKKEISINDIKKTVLDCLKVKKAYPNTDGGYIGYGERNVDINNWIETMNKISKSKNKNDTLLKLTSDWNETDKYNFVQWMKYYEDGNHMKYGFDKQATSYLDLLLDQDNLEQTIQDPLLEQQEEPIKITPNVRKKEQSLQDYKRSLVSRLMSAEKLLANFSSIIPQQQWSYLYQTLSKLKGEIIQLKVADSINDCIIRTAAIFDHNNFSEGADELRKAAAPSGNLAKRIETALSGSSGGATGDMGDDFGGGEEATLPDTDLPTDAELDMGQDDLPAPPKKQSEENLDVEKPKQEDTGADLDVEEPSPSPEPDIDVEEPSPSPEPDIDVSEPIENDNPFAGSNPEDVISLLNPLLQNARNRANVRILTKADMMLDGQGVAGYLPELGEAIMKQIECDNYIANRLEKIIGKLQSRHGATQQVGAPTSAPVPAPSVDMGEITGNGDIDVEEPIEETPAIPAQEMPTEISPEVQAPGTQAPEVPAPVAIPEG